MKFQVPNILIDVAAVGQIFTALIYPYIRHVVPERLLKEGYHFLHPTIEDALPDLLK